MNLTSEGDPIRHTLRIKDQMRQLVDHLREDVGKVTEPNARALFETSAEVITGLIKAFDDYEKGSEKAWRPEPLTSRPSEKTGRPKDDTPSHADYQKLQADRGKKRFRPEEKPVEILSNRTLKSLDQTFGCED